jgi:hypothetical protein
MQRFNKRGLAAIAAVASLMAVGSAHAATNLITDSDFSTPAVGGGYTFTPNGTVGTWMNTNGDTLEVGNNAVYGLSCYSASICQNLEVNANTYDTVSQTVSGLQVGKTYTLSYAYGGRPGGGEQALDVSFGGVLLTTNTGSLGVWTDNSFTFKATDAMETLTFASQNLGGLPSYGNEITNVSLTAVGVPEPAAWAMMMVGLGGIGAALRRRNAQTSALA